MGWPHSESDRGTRIFTFLGMAKLCSPPSSPGLSLSRSALRVRPRHPASESTSVQVGQSATQSGRQPPTHAGSEATVVISPTFPTSSASLLRSWGTGIGYSPVKQAVQSSLCVVPTAREAPPTER